jgi:hypothetical protein
MIFEASKAATADWYSSPSKRNQIEIKGSGQHSGPKKDNFWHGFVLGYARMAGNKEAP